jgi:hypothetical protein
MRIFLSYGHDEHTAFALRLKSDLERRGHQVWFDQDRLKPGADYVKEWTILLRTFVTRRILSGPSCIEMPSFRRHSARVVRKLARLRLPQFELPQTFSITRESSPNEVARCSLMRGKNFLPVDRHSVIVADHGLRRRRLTHV